MDCWRFRLLVPTVILLAAMPSSPANAEQVQVPGTTTSTAPDAYSDLPFRLTPTEKLKVAGRLGKALMLTESGTIQAHTPSAPLCIVDFSRIAIPINHLKSFSEVGVRDFKLVKDLRNFRGRTRDVAGMAGYELRADARLAKFGNEIQVYQVIATDERRYLSILCLVDAERAAELLPEFRRVTGSLRITTATRKESGR